jgi:phosphoglycolate phosphatase
VIRSAGMKTAVVSNKADLGVQTLVRAHFPGLFDLAVGEQEGVRLKPAPDAVLSVLESLAVPKEDAVYIGDSDVDIQTAQNAGIPCISVDWGFRSTEFLIDSGAKLIVSSPDELTALLLNR